MQLNRDNVCHRCQLKDKDKEPPLLSDANEMDPGEVPEHLPALSQVEEMLIARVHLHLEAKRIRGLQYQYTGHTVCFMNNSTKLYDTIPLLPRHLDLFLLRPPQSGGPLPRQYLNDFKVNRSKIVQWLTFLKRNCPAYRDILIDANALSQLPEDGNVLDDILTLDDDLDGGDAIDSGPPDGEGLDDNDALEYHHSSSVVPDLLVDRSERELLASQLDLQRGHLEMPSFRQTPIDETAGQALFTMAFPTLFPLGKADFSIPRLRTVSLSDWAQHLMRYKDGRFGSHPRFRYMLFNQIMRQRVASSSRWFANKNNGHSLTVDDLRQILEPDSEDYNPLLNNIFRQGNVIAGARPFWSTKRRELQAYCRNLGCRALYYTFSAADMQWDDLQRQMPQYDEYLAGNRTTRLQIVRDNLQNHPHIAAGWLYRRWQLFLKHVFKPVVGFKDNWYRFEWQARGSGHIHGVCWLPDAPVADMSTEESRSAFASYWSRHVKAVNPAPNRRPDPQHPSSLPPDQILNSTDFLASCLNRVQRHKCTDAYCLRKKKNSDEKVCRFAYPRPLQDADCMLYDEERDFWTFAPERNDPWLNPYAPVLTLGWLANIDVNPPTSERGLVEYVSKYVGKAEAKSTSYKDMLRQTLPRVNSRAPLLSLTSKLLNKLVGERDWPIHRQCEHRGRFGRRVYVSIII